MISSLISVNNTKHIALFNYDNSMCYHISVLQRLHSSPTLNELCFRLSINEQTIDKNNILEVLMLPVKIYSEINDSNDLVIYTRIKEYFKWFVPNYVSIVGRHGYTPNNLFIYFILPVIYHYFPNEFKTIIEELHVSKINFNNIDYVCDDVILNDDNTFLENIEYRNIILNCYKQMISNLPNKIDRHNFVSAILEIFPNKDRTGGHAVTLILGRTNLEIENFSNNFDDFYVIDDQNTISKLSDYYNLRKEKLYEISIRDIDEITIANINAVLHAKCNIDPSCKFSKRVTRFVLNFEHNFLSTTEDLLKSELNFINVKRKGTLENTSDNNLFKLMFMFICGLVVGIIIGLISNHYIWNKNSQNNIKINNNNTVDDDINGKWRQRWQ